MLSFWFAVLLPSRAEASTCGDGIWNSVSEECDDGDLSGGDGCAADCTIEAGFTCTGSLDLNTGGDGSGGVRSYGLADRQWQWSATADGAGSTPAIITSNCASYIGGWVPDSATSRWINRGGCLDGGGAAPDGTNTYYTVSFPLPTEAVASRTVLRGKIWADNSVFDVLVNGNSTGVYFGPAGFTGDGVSFGDWPSAYYQSGWNTITVVSYNAPRDPGTLNNPDGLRVSVQSGVSTCEQTCGNGTLDAGEQCEDSNTVDGDGCSHYCVVEELCDGIDQNLDGLADDGFPDSDGDGTADCMETPGCGDGVWESSDEECDDGDVIDGDGCSADCRIEEGYTCFTALDVNTGGDGLGGVAAVGSLDRLWTWSTSPDGTGSAPATVSANCAAYVGGWTSETAGARWINRGGCGVSAPDGALTYYTVTFDLASEAVASGTVLSGTFWADNSVHDVLVNGISTGVTFGPWGFTGAGVSFGDWPSAYYQAGENSITVVSYNAPRDVGVVDNPDGLLVSVPGAYTVASNCVETCGDGILESWEGCDDDNTVDGDGCDSRCVLEEICDGIDQNLDGIDDDGFPDSDGDGAADCVDVPDPVDTDSPEDTDVPVDTDIPADTDAPVDTDVPPDTDTPAADGYIAGGCTGGCTAGGGVQPGAGGAFLLALVSLASRRRPFRR
jgi:cysteine-rich repeat protein